MEPYHLGLEGGGVEGFADGGVEGTAMAGVNDWEHRMQLNFLPAKKWMISLHNELYHSSEKGYERIRVSSTLQSYTLTHLRPREVLVKVCWDL